jgi:diacylglycerol kinase
VGERFRLSERIESFRCAFRGVGDVVRSQHNAWIHAAATVAVCALGVALQLPRSDWLWLVLAIGLVWTTEALNTALELLADSVHPEPHPLVARAKDAAAAAVLTAAATAAIIGFLVLGPPLLRALGLY